MICVNQMLEKSIILQWIVKKKFKLPEIYEEKKENFFLQLFRVKAQDLLILVDKFTVEQYHVSGTNS